MTNLGQERGGQAAESSVIRDPGTVAHHTPGPWQVDISPLRKTLCVTADNRDTWICGELLNPHNPLASGEAEANARLISAAPDMLAALRRALAVVDSLAEVTAEAAPDMREGFVMWRGEINAAIAKAEGRS